YAKRQTRKERAAMLIAGLPAAALVVPQLLLYSQQGIFEGKYEAAAAVGVAGAAMLAVMWLERRGHVRLYRVGLGLWTATLAAFALSTWPYARYFTEDSLQLNLVVDTHAASKPTSHNLDTAADA